ncbi:MAG: hypothetical protein ACRDTA_11060 [Pseudonocardiaceae bacterium]
MTDRPDPAARIHAGRDSIRAKLSTLPKVDHNGRFEVDENATRYPAGLVEPTPTTKTGDRR